MPCTNPASFYQPQPRALVVRSPRRIHHRSLDRQLFVPQPVGSTSRRETRLVRTAVRPRVGRRRLLANLHQGSEPADWIRTGQVWRGETFAATRSEYIQVTLHPNPNPNPGNPLNQNP